MKIVLIKKKYFKYYNKLEIKYINKILNIK